MIVEAGNCDVAVEGTENNFVATSRFLWFTNRNLYQWPVVVTRLIAPNQHSNKAKKLEEIAVK